MVVAMRGSPLEGELGDWGMVAREEPGKPASVVERCVSCSASTAARTRSNASPDIGGASAASSPASSASTKRLKLMRWSIGSCRLSTTPARAAVALRARAACGQVEPGPSPVPFPQAFSEPSRRRRPRAFPQPSPNYESPIEGCLQPHLPTPRPRPLGRDRSANGQPSICQTNG